VRSCVRAFGPGPPVTAFTMPRVCRAGLDLAGRAGVHSEVQPRQRDRLEAWGEDFDRVCEFSEIAGCC